MLRRFSQISFLGYIVLIALVFISIGACRHGRDDYYVQTVKIPEGFTHDQKVELSAMVVPHPRQMKWFEDEFFGFIHFGPNTYSGREWGTGFEDAALFNPGDLDTDQWCEIMKAAGIRRVIMVVKHHEGYCLWQTRYTSHSVASSPWRDGQGDVLRELVESCDKYGLRLGIYLSPADLYQIESQGGYYGNGSEFSSRVIPRKVDGRPFRDQRTFKYLVDDYNEYFLNQLFELLTEYGPVYEVWFDGANPKPGTGQKYTYDSWYEMIYELAPEAVIFGKGPDVRWCGNEGGSTRDDEYNVIPLNVSPDSFDWPDMRELNIAGRDRITEETAYFHYYPAETNTSIRHGWFWRNDEEQQVRTADDVFDIFERSVGGNSVFHLNIPPDTLGRFSGRDSEVLVEVGRRIKMVYGHNLIEDATVSFSEDNHQNKPALKLLPNLRKRTLDYFSGNRHKPGNMMDGNTDTWWQSPAKEAVIIVALPEPRRVNRFMIREPIAFSGERIEEHRLEARSGGEWIPVAEGKTVGHKRILRFPPVNTDSFRISVNMARLRPSISAISAHFYDEPPKPVVVRRESDGLVSMGVGLSFVWNYHGMADQSQVIYYTFDGSEPSTQSAIYEGPLEMPLGGHIRARAYSGEKTGSITEVRIGIDRKGWSATDSEGRVEEPSRVLNGNARSRWISGESSPGGHSITIDMKQIYTISGFSYMPDFAGGFIESYHVEISADGVAWKTVHQGSFGNIMNDPGIRRVLLDRGYEARYLKLSGLTAPGGLKRVGAVEIEVFAAF